MRNFLWGEDGEVKRDHLMNWEIVKLPIPQGGLGVRDLEDKNSALLGKWLWRFPHEPDSLRIELSEASMDLLHLYGKYAPIQVLCFSFLGSQFLGYFKNFFLLFDLKCGAAIQLDFGKMFE